MIGDRATNSWGRLMLEELEQRLMLSAALFPLPEHVIIDNTNAADGTRSVFAIDIDGDGDQDVLSASELDNRIVWYHNASGDSPGDLDGDGQFTADDIDLLSRAIRGDDSSGPMHDLNGDSLVDSDDHTYLINVIFNTGMGDADLDHDVDVDDLNAWKDNRFTTGHTAVGNGWSQGDFDGDGDVDIDDLNLWKANRFNNYLGKISGQVFEDINADGVHDPGEAGLTGREVELIDAHTRVVLATTTTYSEDTDGSGDIDPDTEQGLYRFEGLDLGAYEVRHVPPAGMETSSPGARFFSQGYTGVEEVDPFSAEVINSFYYPRGADSARSVFAADIDGDGDQDAISASYDGFNIAWYENMDGRGTFGPQQLISFLADRAYSVYAADIDGDGDQDVLVAYGWDAKIVWYENTDGKGTFAPEQEIATSVDGVTPVIAADIDGDGDQDVLSASDSGSKIFWHENTDGLGTFGSQHEIATFAYLVHSVIPADVDGDGDLDVFSAFASGNNIAWYENTDGLGTFGPQQMITTLAGDTYSLFAADFDGDGDQDIVSASLDDDTIAWYENTDGLGTFGPQLVITTSAGGARSVFAADLDGDGDQDVVSASENDDKLAWYVNIDGLGTLELQQVITTSADGAQSVFVADIDGDGDQDILSASSEDDKIAWYENTDGLGTFGSQQIINASYGSGGSTWANFTDFAYAPGRLFCIYVEDINPVQQATLVELDSETGELLDADVVYTYQEGDSYNWAFMLAYLDGKVYITMPDSSSGQQELLTWDPFTDQVVNSVQLATGMSWLTGAADLGALLRLDQSAGPPPEQEWLGGTYIVTIDPATGDELSAVPVLFPSAAMTPYGLSYYKGEVIINWFNFLPDGNQRGRYDPKTGEYLGMALWDLDYVSMGSDGVSGAYRVDMYEYGSTEGRDFGVYTPAQISGQIFADWNEDGIHDPNEPGLEASKIYKIDYQNAFRVELYDTASGQLVQTAVTHNEDLNGDGVIDEQTERGLFSFKHLSPGEYELIQVLPVAFQETTSDWSQNAPLANGSHTVSVLSGESSSGWDFADIHTDFTGDALWDAADIDLLFAEMGATPPFTGGSIYDLNWDGVVDTADADYLILNIIGTGYGDADLDGDVDVDDLNMLKANMFTTGTGWASGDFDGDGDTDIDDLNIWKANRFTTYDAGDLLA